MPKPLREPPPSSSVARLLDVDAASRATAPPDRGEPATSPPSPSNDPPSASHREQPVAYEAGAAANIVSPRFPLHRPTGEPANVKREFVLSPSTDETFTRLLELYRRSTGTRLSGSHVARAMLKGISQCMDSIQREAALIGRQKLPSNARGREGERERFEEAVAKSFIAGIRSAASYRRERP